MRLLVDTDIFCKLGVSGLLDPALAALGVTVDECGRLQALPYMLRKDKKLLRLYGVGPCATLAPVADSMPVAPGAGEAWLEQLVGVDQIDFGEAQLFAAASEGALIIVSGDKRALRAVARLPAFCAALSERIITLEAVLLELCRAVGVPAVRQALQPLAADRLVRVCFSPSNQDPEAALRSYLGALAAEVAPLRLWQPGMGAPR